MASHIHILTVSRAGWDRTDHNYILASQLDLHQFKKIRGITVILIVTNSSDYIPERWTECSSRIHKNQRLLLEPVPREGGLSLALRPYLFTK